MEQFSVGSGGGNPQYGREMSDYGKMMRYLILPLLLLVLAACSSKPKEVHTPYASGNYLPDIEQCVPFARRASGFEFYGNAHTWWDQVRPPYSRGAEPRPGAVLVLARTPRMKHGHVAVVRRIVDARQIDVTHSNWGNNRQSRRVAYDSMRVEDVSPGNDWSSVRFWNPDVESFGFPYQVRGFIYRD